MIASSVDTAAIPECMSVSPGVDVGRASTVRAAKEEDSPVGYSRLKYRSAEYCREEHVQGVHASPGIERLMRGVVSRSGERSKRFGNSG